MGWPIMAAIEEGPSVARIFSVTTALFADLLIAAFFLGVPLATAATIPMLCIPAVLLWSTKTSSIVAGYYFFAVAAVPSAVAPWFIPDLHLGLRARASLIWAFLAFTFVFGARMFQARGARQ